MNEWMTCEKVFDKVVKGLICLGWERDVMPHFRLVETIGFVIYLIEVPKGIYINVI